MRGRPQSDRVLFVSEHFLDDPKIRCLSDSEFRSWIRILLEQLKGGNGSQLPDWNYGLTRKRRERLIEVGLLDEIEGALHVHGWDRWNGREAYKRFLARERKRRQRARDEG